MPGFNPTFSIPGPGAAMALAAAASIYSATIVDASFTKYFIWITLIFITAACFIEYMHITKDKIEVTYTVGILIFLIMIILFIGYLFLIK